MKKLYVIIGLIAFSYNIINCQEPAIEMTTISAIGSDFNFDIAANADNTDIQVDYGDGVLVNITIYSYITWITGTVGESRIIEIYGSGIIHLNCSDNKLVHINTSNATELEYLDCNYNLLSSMDVTNNLNLNSLFVDLNGLSSLDVTHNVYLEKLSLTNNYMTNLDVSNNVLLSELNCGGNRLTQLNVTHNDSLANLNCNFQPISYLDLNNNLVLTGLACNNCQLTTLDVSKNVLLEYLGCDNNLLNTLDVSNNIALESLTCSNNQIHTLDLSMNTNLKDIWCEINQITELKLGNMPYLWRLICQYNKINSLDLSHCPELSEIDCNNNHLSEFDISNCNKLTWIECYENYLSFTKLPLPDTSWIRYKYAPQTIPIPKVFSTGDLFDLNNEYNINGNITHYNWKSKYGADLEIMNDYTISEGRTVFLNQHIDSVYCEMTNATFPQFKETSKLITTCMEIMGDNIPLLSMTTLNETGSTILFSLKAGIENTPIRIDYGNGILVFDTIGTDETLFNSTIVGSQTVNIYGQGIISWNCDNNHIISLNIANDTSLITLSCRNNLLCELDLNYPQKLNSLDCSHNNISNLQGAIGENLKSLICNYNKLTFATLLRNFGFWPTYIYAPQKSIDIVKTIALGNGLDLSSQCFVSDVFDDPVWSNYKWKTQSGVTLSEGIDYTINDGITVFNTMFEDSIYCEITNEIFPDFTGSDVLKTTFTKLVQCNFVEDIINLEPRIYSNDKSIYIDAPFEGSAMVYDINGMLITNAEINPGICTIQMKRTGIYLLIFINKNKVYSKKLLVR